LQSLDQQTEGHWPPDCLRIAALGEWLVVTEYKPFVHRLRHEALGLGPTNPERITLPQETLGFRWASFSLAFTLLIPAFSLPVAPPVFTVRLHSCWNAPLPFKPKGSNPQLRCEA